MKAEKDLSWRKLQVAVDFLASYGIAILIVLIAIAIAYTVSSGVTNAFSSQCTPFPGFSCTYYSLTDNGVLTAEISQATGAAITVKGVACSTLQNTTGLPAYGNKGVTLSPAYYPTANSIPGSVSVHSNIPSGGTGTFYLYCYGPTGIIKSPKSGSSVVAYLWMNYSIQNTGIKTIQQVASLALQTVYSANVPT